MNDNKTPRTFFEKHQYVIVVKQDGVSKYVSKHYGHRNEFKYTVLLNKAYKFNGSELAEKYAKERNIKNVIKIAEVKHVLSLVTELPS